MERKKKKKRKGRNRDCMWHWTLHLRIFAFTSHFLARIPRTNKHRRTITQFLVFPLSLSFIRYYCNVCVYIYIYLYNIETSCLTHTHTYVYRCKHPPPISAHTHTEKRIHTLLSSLSCILTAYNFYRHTIIMAHNKEWIRISSTFPSFPYLSHANLTPSHARTCVLLSLSCITAHTHSHFRTPTHELF